MKNKYVLFLLLFLCFADGSKANMGEMVSRGTLGTRPFTNQYIDIIKETLFIKIDKGFEYASIRATYFIKSEKDGINIPLLFYASDFQEDFIVKVDGEIVEIREVPYDLKIAKGTQFEDFDYFFKESNHSNQSEVIIHESVNNGFYISLKDMKYFETDISKGEHKIEVSYTSKKWTDGWDWINEYSFRYALSPAKYWKSFGDLDIIIDAKEFDSSFITNLGNPSTVDSGKNPQWIFKEIPMDVIHITHIPKINFLSRVLLFINPLGASILLGLLLFILHYKLLKDFRKKHPNSRYNWMAISGSIISPIIILFIWIKFADWIKLSLGSHAGMGIDPYATIFIPILFYPILLLFFSIIMWQIDKKLKNNIGLKK